MNPERILITGISRGLGLALANQLRARGHLICGCARNAAQIEHLQSAFGPQHYLRAVDISDSAAVDAWCKDCIRHWGIPDRIINNAAIINQPAPLWKVSADEFDRLMAINVAGSLHVIRACLPAMIKRGSGMIINLSSGAGRMGLPRIGAYCASKWAIEGLSRSLAEELPANLGVVALSPGMVDTDMLRICYPDEAPSQSSADAWARASADAIVALSPADSGQSITMAC